jgi:hypothetical protein
LVGFSVGNAGRFVFSHFLFVDGTLICCGAYPTHFCHLRCLFHCFEAALGLKVNLAKSELVHVAHVVRLVGVLSCGVSSLLVKYLGLPLGASYKAKHIYDGVIEMIERQLGWKMMYLSKNGRVTLIKSTLANLSTHFMSLFPLPQVLLTVLRSSNVFYWGGPGEEFKYHLVSWFKV